MAKLIHRFDLAKLGNDTPLLGVQVTVDYNPTTGGFKIDCFGFYNYRHRQFVDGTNIFGSTFIDGVIAEEIQSVDWNKLYQESLQIEARNKRLRIHDNKIHSINL